MTGAFGNRPNRDVKITKMNVVPRRFELICLAPKFRLSVKVGQKKINKSENTVSTSV